MAKKPTPQQIAEAGRQLQRGGILGRGSQKAAHQVVEQARAAGMDTQIVAMEILAAAGDHEPRWWAR